VRAHPGSANAKGSFAWWLGAVAPTRTWAAGRASRLDGCNEFGIYWRIILLFFTQRTFIQGITLTGLKG